MGQDRPAMDRDGHVSSTYNIPNFLGAFEAEEKVKSLFGSGKISREKLPRDEEERGVEEEEEQTRDAENNNNNGGGGEDGGVDAVQSMKEELLAPTSPLDRTSPDGQMQGGEEVGQGDINAVCDDNEKPGRGEVQNEPPPVELTPSDTGRVDILSLLETNREKCDTSLNPDVTPRVNDHIYCTVYCIANEEQHNTDIPQVWGNELTSGLDGGLVLYTEEDLVDPLRGASLLRAGTDADVEAQLCRVCLEEKTIVPLPCCRKLVCDECLTLYVTSQVQEAKASIRCPISECSGMLENAAVESWLGPEDVLRYRYFLELSQLDSSTKPCPRCRRFTSLERASPARSEQKYKIQCSDCQFVWCFKCHAPWHQGIKCRDYRKGDKQLRSWACVIERGQRNAQKCPKCMIHIQRTEGCDHMVCTQCNTNFCYRCGERYRQLRYFGDHTSNLSVFGCKYRYLPDKPHLRRFIRGSICGAKVLLAPLVLSLVLVLGAVALVIGLIGFPFYYVCKKRKRRATSSLGSWRF
ncbi:probable E3 ubiquitin-protein ligase RNF217 [Corythoichthys intestinalis]|uniref:probable E3 ubiquitin-protein ligase RNF217 n=1 Tax=Corythoichthys intestinalis TaxID=161448 RepID=UPI0025A5C5AC|nr:probable E3 ubiquitin-protein ligase RNF217 [Corythoichthys intestinalis]XP_061806434.1 E3 ubiquitin-protein ligase RNF217-like [Nerophis lumbriciformis]